MAPIFRHPKPEPKALPAPAKQDHADAEIQTRHRRHLAQLNRAEHVMTSISVLSILLSAFPDECLERQHVQGIAMMLDVLNNYYQGEVS